MIESSHTNDPEIVAAALAGASQAGATQADAVLIRSDSREVRVRGDEIEFVKQAAECCLGIRALVQHAEGLSSAVVSTCDLSDEAVGQMAADAVALAQATAPDPHAGLPEEKDFATDLPDLALVDRGDSNVAIEARIEDARRAERAARDFDSRIDNSEGSRASSDFSQIVYANSRNFVGQYEGAYHALYSSPLASDGDGKQTDHWGTVGRTLADLEDAASVGRQAAERTVSRLGARQVPTCEAPVIFDAFTAPSLVGQLATCLSGYSIFRKSSFLTESMGQQIASEQVTLIDDGRLPGGLGSKPFDGEGLATRRNVLVQNGKLESWLLDSYSGRKLGLESTGSASRGAGSGPGVSPTNLWLEPGELSLAELIRQTGSGLLVTGLMGMGFNPTTGDYSQGARGFWIEKGEVTFPVEEITIASNFGTMLNDIDAVGEELIWRSRVASPPLRIRQMTIAGE